MTKSNSAFRLSPFPLHWLLLIAAVPIVYFTGLTIPLVGPDEPRYAQVAREMFERGDWVTPTLGGFNWFEKPALLYWLQIASYNFFGVSEFAARFGSALFGIGTILSLWTLGRHIDLKNDEERTTNDFAFWLTLIGASTVGIIAFAHGASFDIILTFPITAAMVSFYIYDSENRLMPLLSFYFFIGLALLAKGLVGLVFPILIVGAYYLLSWRKPTAVFFLSLFWGSLLSILVASVWYVPMYLTHGFEFIDEFFIQHHFQRYTSNKYFHPQPFYFFFWVLPLMTIPWTPFFLAGVWDIFHRSKIRSTESVVPWSLRIFCLGWIAVPLIFFSFSGSKLPGYILPVVPATIVLTAAYVFENILPRRSGVTLVRATAAATFVIVLAAIFLVVPRFAETDSVKGLLAMANERGLETAPVMMLHGISHNAEFYAAGRIVRDVEGKQKRFLGPEELAAALNAFDGKPSLVLVPMEYLSQLLESRALRSEPIADNGELAIVAIYQR